MLWPKQSQIVPSTGEGRERTTAREVRVDGAEGSSPFQAPRSIQLWTVRTVIPSRLAISFCEIPRRGHVDHLLKSLLIVRQPRQTLVFSALITSLPPLIGLGNSKSRKWSLRLPELFVAASDQRFNRLHEIFCQMKAVRDRDRLRGSFTCGLCVVI